MDFFKANCDLNKIYKDFSEIGVTLSDSELEKVNSIFDECDTYNDTKKTNEKDGLLNNSELSTFLAKIATIIPRIRDKIFEFSQNFEKSTNDKTEQLTGNLNPEKSKNSSKNNDAIPTEISSEEISEALKYNDIKYANQKGVLLNGKYYDFDENGRCRRIYNEKPKFNINGNPNSYTYIRYDENGEVAEFYRYMNEGKINSAGQRTCIVYDKNGKVRQYYIESNFNQITGDARRQVIYTSSGEISFAVKNKYDNKGYFTGSIEYIPNDKLDELSYKIRSNLDNLTEENLTLILNEIENMEIDSKDSDEADVNNLYFIMQNYAECTGTQMLEDIAKINPKLADFIIDYVKENETAENEDWYKYTKDIVADMEEHPNDYKKLSVDVQRLMHRSWIDKKGDHGDNVLNLNNQLDKTVKQDATGNCYLLSTIKSMDSSSKGRVALNSIRQNLPNGDVLITCKGNNKTYRITKEEILEADHLSTGDDDMRVYELAMDKYRRDIAYETIGAECDSTSGTMPDVLRAFWGIQAVTSFDIEDFNFEDFNTDNNIYSFSIAENINQEVTNPYPKVSIVSSSENTDLIINHEYRITKYENCRIYFTNPWNDSEELSMQVEEFKKIANLNCNKFNLNTL